MSGVRGAPGDARVRCIPVRAFLITLSLSSLPAALLVAASWSVCRIHYVYVLSFRPSVLARSSSSSQDAQGIRMCNDGKRLLIPGVPIFSCNWRHSDILFTRTFEGLVRTVWNRWRDFSQMNTDANLSFPCRMLNLWTDRSPVATNICTFFVNEPAGNECEWICKISRKIVGYINMLQICNVCQKNQTCDRVSSRDSCYRWLSRPDSLICLIIISLLIVLLCHSSLLERGNLKLRIFNNSDVSQNFYFRVILAQNTKWRQWACRGFSWSFVCLLGHRKRTKSWCSLRRSDLGAISHPKHEI
jgi:hypothetical protein